jgi:transposase
MRSQPELPVNLDLNPVVIGHLPLIRAAIDRLGIRAVIDQFLPQDARSEVSDADCVTLAIANILHGRVALYDMGEWLAGMDVGLLLWEGCPPDAFNDDRLGKCLDHLFDAGTDSIFGAVAERFLSTRPRGEAILVPTDTTTLSLQGAYATPDERPGAPVPARGHSKDFRPDLKQLVYGMSLHGPTGIPLCASMLDGNTADARANRIHIDKLAQLLPAADDVTLVADCKFVDTVTLGWARRSGFHYVSLLPRTYTLRDTLVEEVRVGNVGLSEVGRYSGRLKADPDKVYRATSFVRPLPVSDPESSVQEMLPHRLVVVWSSSQAALFDAALGDRLRKEREAFVAAFARLGAERFDCEADARHALARHAPAPEWHHLEVAVVPVDEQVPRTRRGRPRNDEIREMRRRWRVELQGFQVDDAAVDHDRFHASHFVLVSSRADDPAWTDRRIFEAYRAQHSIEGHTGFRWLKDAAAVAPVFLKLAHRIAALGLVFLLALVVRNWIEGTLRARLAETQGTLPDMNDRPTPRPSAEAAMRLFALVQGVQVRFDGHVTQRQVHRLSPAAEKVLQLLGIPVSVFWEPRVKLGGAGGG